MKKPISIKLDEALWVHIKSKTNKSAYISELIKQDLQQAKIKPITESVINELLTSEVFFNEMSQRLKVKSVQFNAPVKSDVFVPRPPDPQVGYPCCQKPAPCKHWKFNDIEQHWVNELTGEVKSE